MTISEGVSLATVGVTLTVFTINQVIERNKKGRELRVQAYLLLLEAMSECEAFPPGSEEHNLARAKTLNARHQIILFGSGAVVDAMANYFSTSGNHHSEPQRTNFCTLIRAMQFDARSGKVMATSAQILQILVDQPRTFDAANATRQ